jgi:hypothetical protein
MRASFSVVAFCWLCVCGCQHGRDSLPVPEHDPPVALLRKTGPLGGMEVYYAYTNAQGVEIRHGPCTAFYPNGVKQREENYFEDKLDGRCVIYTHSGRRAISGCYRHGEPWDGEIGMMDSVWKFKKGRVVKKHVTN